MQSLLISQLFILQNQLITQFHIILILIIQQIQPIIIHLQPIHLSLSLIIIIPLTIQQLQLTILLRIQQIHQNQI